MQYNMCKGPNFASSKKVGGLYFYSMEVSLHEGYFELNDV